jgi:putative membrane protein
MTPVTLYSYGIIDAAKLAVPLRYTEAEPTTAHLHWHTEAALLVSLLLVLLLYGLGVRLLRQRRVSDATLVRRQTGYFVLALIVLYGAVASPLDALGEQYLFSAHMLQHIILLYPVPMLLLLGMPGGLLRPLLTLPVVAPVVRFFTHPLIAFVAFNLAFAAWHIPGLYEWALRDRTMHNLEHVTFLATAILMWWPLLSPLREYPRLTPGLQTLYLLALSLGQLPVFAYVTFANRVLYPTYETAPRLLPLTPLADQQLGGIIMKIAGMAVLFTMLAIAFWQWYRLDDSLQTPRLAPRREQRVTP